MTSPITLPIGVTENAVKVHPVVLFTICDAYIRRNENQERVIGTLLGTVSDGYVEIKSCYAVPHSESNDHVSQPPPPTCPIPMGLTRFSLPLQVALDVQHHQTMANLQARVNPLEKVVGWFSTGFDVSGSDALIHSFYGNETSNPVHLTLDTGLNDGHMKARAYVSRTLSIAGRELAREFQEVPCETMNSEAERIGGEILANQQVEKLPGDIEGFAMSLERLEVCLTAAKAYVDAVIAGKQPGDVAVGRALTEAVAAVPHFSVDDFQKLIKDNENDVLLTMYLANLIKAHIALADRLGTMQLPLV